ncbi:ABC transporter ATP-binding protein [Virgibacillus byunsanensis]|uniref:ABC transporter ATP-binding protein n=1 Tax=Virgibacillus byunsanensis TaxID=570945 RepID=A0ABW3LG70_9BACI
MKAILETHDLKVQYGEVVAVDNLSITVPIGESVGLIGPNGAGKTTLLKALSGVLPVSKGNVKYMDKDVTSKKSYEMSRMGVSLIPEGRLPFASLTVKENLLLPAYSIKLNKNEIKEHLEFVYDLFPRLKERSNQKAGNLSGGEQQMMVISRALMMRPKVLLIDEPSLGLAPIIIEQIYEVIPKLLKTDLSILLVEQSSELALSVCSNIYVMREGKMVHSGNADRLNKSELAEYYLR